MKLKETKWRTCRTCHQRTTVIQEESFGCDECHKAIDEQLGSRNTQHHDHLEVTIFRKKQEGAWKNRLDIMNEDQPVLAPALALRALSAAQEARRKAGQ